MAGLVEGKVALVTGAASGIGRASALTFAREGARVVVVDVDREHGEETVRMITAAGSEAAFVSCDVTSAGEVEALVGRAVELFGRLDCAHNNAGIMAVASVEDTSEELFDRVIAINLKGVWLCMKYEISQMERQGGGAIVNTASLAGLIGSPSAIAYTASKHGVVGLTRAAAVEYSRRNIRINAVCPGMTRTPFVEALPPAEFAMYEDRQPAGRLAEPEEIAEAAVWLCSDRASFVNGVPFPVDAGAAAD